MKDCGRFVIYHIVKPSKMLTQQLKKVFSVKKKLGLDAFTIKFYQTLKDEIHPIIHNFFKMRKRRTT